MGRYLRIEKEKDKIIVKVCNDFSDIKGEKIIKARHQAELRRKDKIEVEHEVASFEDAIQIIRRELNKEEITVIKKEKI